MIYVFWNDPIGSIMVILLGMIPAFLPLIPAMAVAFWARRRVDRARTPGAGAVAGWPPDAEALARAILPDGDRVAIGGGAFADFYDPRRRELRLSPEVAPGRSPWAMAVAALEAGHALGREAGYRPGRVRAPVMFLAKLGAGVGWLAILSGLVLLYPGLCARGVWLEVGSVAALASLVVVERDAARRARAALSRTGIASGSALEFDEALEAATLAGLASAWPVPRAFRRRKSLHDPVSAA